MVARARAKTPNATRDENRPPSTGAATAGVKQSQRHQLAHGAWSARLRRSTSRRSGLGVAEEKAETALLSAMLKAGAPSRGAAELNRITEPTTPCARLGRARDDLQVPRVAAEAARQRR